MRIRVFYIIIFLILGILLLNLLCPVVAKASDERRSEGDKVLEINFFYSVICPHCKKENKFLDDLEKKYSNIKINRFEVIYDRNNRELLEGFYKQYNVPKNEQGNIPVTFISQRYFIGFNDNIAKEIESCIEECIHNNQKERQLIISFPFWGEIDLTKLSLPVLTLVLGTLDGFNPCAMWILVVLISLLLSLKSRRKIALVGGIFIFGEGLLYFLFMSVWLNAFLWMRYVYITQVLIGIFGIGFGIFRIKEFIEWKPGVCQVVAKSGFQRKIIDKMKKVLELEKLPAIIIGVLLLSFGVNIIELFCSAGFPVMYTRILTFQNIGPFKYYLYLLFYNILYMLDDIIVFSVALVTLSHFGFSDKYNRYTSLVAGILLLILGILLIFKPEFLMFS